MNINPFWLGFASAIVSVYGFALISLFVCARCSPIAPRSAVDEAEEIARAAARDEVAR